METVVSRTLGTARIKEICQRFSLTEKDENIIDEILVEWEKNLGQIEKKMAIALKKCEKSDNQKMIMKTVLVISLEFFKERRT